MGLSRELKTYFKHLSQVGKGQADYVNWTLKLQTGEVRQDQSKDQQHSSAFGLCLNQALQTTHLDSSILKNGLSHQLALTLPSFHSAYSGLPHLGVWSAPTNSIVMDLAPFFWEGPWLKSPAGLQRWLFVSDLWRFIGLVVGFTSVASGWFRSLEEPLSKVLSKVVLIWCCKIVT